MPLSGGPSLILGRPHARKTQYFEIFGNRAIYHDGWMANTVLAVIPCVTAPRTIIATARDSWLRMVPLPRPRAPGQQQAQDGVSQLASFSSQSASSASPPAGPHEPGWA